MTPLQIENLRDFLRAPGPCVTIFLPAYRPGEQTLHSTATLLRNFTQEAARRLETSREGRFLEPLRAMASDPRTDEGCHWARALLLAPGIFETIFLREGALPKLYTGDRFHVLPLLDELSLPPEFYILKISRKHAGFFRVQFSIEALPIPGNLPDNVNGFLNLDKPDHDRENRSSAGPAASRRIRFGTGSERGTESESGAYYRAVDRAMAEVNPKRPLFLAGVEEETALYRSVASSANPLAGTIRDSAPDQETIDEAYATLRKAALDRAMKSLEDARDRLAPARFSTELGTITSAAREGRVLRLFVRSGVDEERINATLLETLIHGGEAVSVPAEKIETPLAAALRY